MSRARILHVAIAIAVVAIVIARSHPRELWDLLGDVDLGLVALVILLNVPVALLAPLRSALVFHALGHDVRPEVLIPSTVVGFVAGGLSPAATGEVLRAVLLRDRANVPYERSLVVIVYERVLATYLLAITTAVVFALTHLELAWQIAFVAAAIALVVAPALVARLLPQPGEAAQPAEEVDRWHAVARAALAMANRLRVLLVDVGLLVRWSAITSAMFGVIALQYWLLARSVADEISFADAWIALGVSTLAAVATLVPFGLGILDSTLAVALDRLGATLEQGEIVALLVRATVTMPLVLGAFAAYAYLQRQPVVGAEPTASDPS